MNEVFAGKKENQVSPSPKILDGYRSGFPLFGWGRLVVGLVLGCGILGYALGSFAKDQPQELPKPFHKTTPPLFQEWNFDQVTPHDPPEGFTQANGGGPGEGEWAVVDEASAPSSPRLVRQRLHCKEDWCYQLLLAEGVEAEYVDLSVRIKMELGTPSGQAGLAFGVQDAQNFYAVVVEPKTNMVLAYVVKDGQPTELAKASLLPEPSEWHYLRIQRTTIISKEFTEIFFDHHLMIDVTDQSFKKGKLGLVAMGNGAFSFDNLRAMELLTSRPLSRPAAY